MSLKEGLTVFRDQEFSADLLDRGVERIDQVEALQASQFKEDSGPMAHAVRPDSYLEINNFYTPTVYEKGAEIVRMMETVIGRKAFGNGLRLYLERYDGSACTLEQFVECLSECGQYDLSPFLSSWYSQRATPQIGVSTHFDFEQKTFSVELEQNNAMLQNEEWTPYLIPLRMSLLNRKMDEHHTAPYELMVDSEAKHGPVVRTLLMTEKKQKWTFYDIEHEPLLSLNRNFSAPIYIQVWYSSFYAFCCVFW